MEMNNITTSGLIIANTSRNVKIESKKIVSQCVPYFFSSIKKDTKGSIKSTKISVKNK